VLGVVKQSLYDSNQLAQRATREVFWAASYRTAFRVLAKVRLSRVRPPSGQAIDQEMFGPSAA